MGGGKGGGSNDAAIIGAQQNAEAAREQLKFARDIRQEVAPLRNLVIGDLRTALQTAGTGGTVVPSVTAAGLEDVASQFGAARRNIIQGGARGGQLTQSLNDLELARAATASGMRRGALQNAFNQAAGIGTQQPALAFQGLSGASQSGAALANIGLQQQALRAQQQMALGQGIGQTVGKLGAAALLGGSDKRLKRIIHKLADDFRGFAWYAFEYLAEPGRRYIGVMAQDVLTIMPEAVSIRTDGYYQVDYGRL